MSFLQFLGYFIASEIIIRASIFSVLYIRYRFVKRKVMKNISNLPGVRMITPDELMDMVENREKKSWN